MTPTTKDVTEQSAGVKRRDFLKVLSVTGAATAAVGCSSGDVEKLIPYLVSPDQTTPGVSNYYATTCRECAAGCVLIVETRDRLKMTCVVVSHDVTSVFRVADRIAFLEKGRLVFHGTPEEFRAASQGDIAAAQNRMPAYIVVRFDDDHRCPGVGGFNGGGQP